MLSLSLHCRFAHVVAIIRYSCRDRACRSGFWHVNDPIAKPKAGRRRVEEGYGDLSRMRCRNRSRRIRCRQGRSAELPGVRLQSRSDRPRRRSSSISPQMKTMTRTMTTSTTKTRTRLDGRGRGRGRGRRGRGLGGMIEKERALRDTLASLGFRRRRLQRRRRQCVSRLHRRTTRWAIARRPSPPTVRATPNATARWPLRIAAQFGLRHEIIRTASSSGRSTAPIPTNRCYFCKHELYTHLTRIAAERGRRRRRRQQRRRSRRLPAGAAGGARIRRAQPARRSGPAARSEIRELSRRAGSADVGRAGVGVSVVAHSVPHRSDRREAPDDRARRSWCSARSDSASAACGTTTSSPRIEIGRDELARALEPETADAISAS